MNTSSLPGGPAAKAGDIYEALWGVQAFVRLLLGEADEMRIEEPGVNGGEFWVRIGDCTEWWQTKRQVSGQNTWTLTKLKREGVLAFFGEKAMAGNECIFASISDAPELRELADRARNAATYDEFQSKFIAESRLAHFEELRGAWDSASPSDTYERLRHIYVEGGPERTIKKQLLAFAQLLFDGNAATTLAVLCQMYLTSPHRSFDLTSLQQQLGTIFGIHSRTDVLHVVRTEVDAIIANFDRFAHPWRSSARPDLSWISRPEQQQLLDERSKCGNKPICLLGVPGSGKTSLLAKIADDCRKQGHAALAIKADVIPDHQSFDAWSEQKLGMGLQLVDAIRVIARKRPVTVIVDQLDALSSLVDLTSDRLNALLGFIAECLAIDDVYVICSCRDFEYYHDTRIANMDGVAINLSLPAWEQIVPLLKDIESAEHWPENFREILRVPQHLRIYLERYRQTGKTEVFQSYQSMLDDLWDRFIQTEEERRLVYRLAEMLSQKESLWAPAIHFESDTSTVEVLESREIIQRRDNTIGFRHQTLLEHARARNFTRNEWSLYDYAFARQDAVHVRPTLWAVLGYLRSADRSKYHSELEAFSKGTLRLHVRYLIIDFLSQVPEPDDVEILFLSDWIGTSEDRQRVLIAIRGKQGWFRALYRSRLPGVMHWPKSEQWPMIGYISAAWSFARESCLKLINDHWFYDETKDDLTWRSLQQLKEWNEDTVQMLCTLIRRAPKDDDRLWWAESLTYTVSSSRPDLAAKVFAAAAGRNLEKSLLENCNSWHQLPEVARAAPMEFLRECWSWFVDQAERFHGSNFGSVLYRYGGHLFSLDRDRFTHAAVTSAILSAVTESAKVDPQLFLSTVRKSWKSENAVVQRVLAKGLTAAAAEIPTTGLEFLCTDNRRLHLGDYRRDQSESIELIKAVVPHLTPEDRIRLESTILGWSQYRKEASLEACQITWDREARLRLLKAIPENYLSAETALLVKREEKDLPEWDRELQGIRSGPVRQKLTMPPEKILSAPDEDLLKLLDAPDFQEASNSTWIEEEQCWERPAGSGAVITLLSSLGQDQPRRLLSLIPALISAGNEEAARSLIGSLEKSSLSDEEIHDLVRQVARLNPRSERLRSDFGNLLYDRSSVGLADDLCDILETWLTESRSPPTTNGDLNREKKEDGHPTPVLWGYDYDSLEVSLAYWPLLGVTYGLLRRKPPDTTRWLALLHRLLDINLGDNLWMNYCSELRWIRLPECDHIAGAAVVEKVFEECPLLWTSQAGLRLIAQVNDLLEEHTIRNCFDALTSSEEAKHRQAYGELVTVVALETDVHSWCLKLLEQRLTSITEDVHRCEAEAVGIAFAAAQLWDTYRLRPDLSKILCRLISVATPNLAYAIGTLFTTAEDFPADEHAEALLQSLAAHPPALAGDSVNDLAEHLAELLPNFRRSVLDTCIAIVDTYEHQLTSYQYNLYGAGPYLVDIAMTVQRFPDTRSDGLALLESLLKLGLDAAFASLPDMELRPVSLVRPERRQRRRQALE